MTQCPLSVTICKIPLTFLRIKVLLRSVLRHQATFLMQLIAENRLLAPFPVAFRQVSFKPRPSLARVSPLLNPLKRPMTLSRLPQSSEGNDGTGPQVLESPDDLSSTGEQPQHSETGSQEKSEGESRTN